MSKPTIDDYIDALYRKIKITKNTMPITDFTQIHLNRKQLQGLLRWTNLHHSTQGNACPFAMRSDDCEICTVVFNITHPRSGMGPHHRKCPCSVYDIKIVRKVAETYIAVEKERSNKAMRVVLREVTLALVLTAIALGILIKLWKVFPPC